MITAKSFNPNSPASQYQVLADLSNDMLEAAQHGNWDDLESLRQESLALTANLEAEKVHASLNKEERQARLRALKRIVANDAEIRRLANPGLEGAERLVRHPGEAEHLPERSKARLESYSIDNPLEIKAHLRKIIARKILVTLYVDGDEGQFLPAVMTSLDSDTGRIGFQATGINPPPFTRFGDSPATLVAFMDSVKIQFPVTQLQIQDARAPRTFTASIPAQFFRAQRRNYFRVQPLFSEPAHCLLALSPPSGEVQEVEILDVGVGGLSLDMPIAFGELSEQQALPGCFVQLPGQTTFRCELLVCYVSRAVTEEGTRRIGLHFRDLDPIQQRTVQLYVNSVEATRRRI
jgi:c-di-GMP-binding flagellar brake protein YcgR